MATGAAFAAGRPAPDACMEGPVALLQAPTTVVSLCDEVADIRASGTYGGRMSAPADSPAMRATEELARRAGLPGLARSSAVLSMADMGGVAAGTGVPALPARVPTGLSNAAQLPEFPDVPGMPGSPVDHLPEVARMAPQLPPVGEVPDVRSLPGRVTDVEDKVAPLLPQQAPELVESLPLSGQAPVEELTDLLENLDLAK